MSETELNNNYLITRDVLEIIFQIITQKFQSYSINSYHLQLMKPLTSKVANRKEPHMR